MKYLSTLKKIGKYPIQVYAQHMQVDNIELRCHYCIFREECKELGSLLICSRKHGCDNFSTMFAQLEAKQKNIVEDDDKFQPSAVTKTITVDYIKRYLQYIYSRYENYNCNRNCYYYPNVSSGQQSIFSCAASHGCGANSCWFTLLNLKDNLEQMSISVVGTDGNTYLVTSIDYDTIDSIDVLVFKGTDSHGNDATLIPYQRKDRTLYYLVGSDKVNIEWQNVTFTSAPILVDLDTNTSLRWLLYFNHYSWLLIFDWTPSKSYVTQMDIVTADKVSHEIYTYKAIEVSEAILDGDENEGLSGSALCFYDEDGTSYYIVAKTGPYKNRLLMTTDDTPEGAEWSDVVLSSATYFGKAVTVALNNDTLQAIRWLIDNGCREELLIF